MKYRYIMLAGLLVLAAGCYKDDDIRVPEDRTEFGYSVPQGTNAFDNRIVEWNGKMDKKLFILYKFAPRDVYWNNTQWDGLLDDGAFPEGFNSAYNITQAQEGNVDAQLRFIEDNFLSLYPASFLKGRLPQKILLAGTIEKHEIIYEGYPVQITEQDTYLGFDNFTIKGGDGQIAAMTGAQKTAFAKSINRAFFSYLASKGLLEVPQDFIDLAGGYQPLPLGERVFYHGFLGTILSGTQAQKAQRDFAMYLEAALETDEFLNKVNNYPAVTNMPQYEGIFYYDPDRELQGGSPWNPVTYKGIGKDKSGKIKAKYDIVVRHMREKYGIDMKAVSATLNAIQ